MGQLTVERPAGARRTKRWLGKGSPRWEGLTSQLQAMAFPLAATGSGKNQRLPWVASQLLVTVFPSVVAELEVDQQSGESIIQLQATTFPCAAAGFGPHSDGLSEDRAEPGLLCRLSRLCGHGLAA